MLHGLFWFFFGCTIEPRCLHSDIPPSLEGGGPLVSLQAASRDGLPGPSGRRVVFRLHAWPPRACIVFTAAGLEMVDIQNIIRRVLVPC